MLIVANPKQELRELLDTLSDEATAEVLAHVRRLVEGALASAGEPDHADLPAGLIRTGRIDSSRPRHAVPGLRQGRRIASADEPRADIFPPEESLEEFDATIRRWRDEPERG